MRKGKNKFIKEMKVYFKDYRFNKHNFYYTTLVLIIILLSIFLVNNYNKCTVYDVSTQSKNFSVNNGLLVLTGDNSILKVTDISYTGSVKYAMYVNIGLYVTVGDENYLLNSFSSTSSDGFDLNDYLETIKFDISENKDNTDIFTTAIKKNIVKNLYLKVEMTSIDGKSTQTEIKLDTSVLYRNDKLFY